MSGIYEGPGDQLLHGDGKPVGKPPSHYTDKPMPKKTAPEDTGKPRCPHGNYAETCVPCMLSTKQEVNETNINRHLKVLGVIATIFVLLFIFVVVEHSGGVRMMLPLVALIFFVYLTYAAITVISKKL